MWCLSLNEFIAVIGILVAAVAAISAFYREEFQARLERDNRYEKWTQHGTWAWYLCIVLCMLLLLVLLWALICWGLSRPLRTPSNRESPPTIAASSPSPIPTPAETEPRLAGDVLVYPPVTVEGNDYQLYVFVDSYNWIIGTEKVEKHKEPMSDDDVIRVFKSIHADMKDQAALIAVGTASSRIQTDNTGEENRADSRGDKLIDMLRFYLGDLKKGEKSPALWKLNIGRCRIEPDSDMQRPLVVIGVSPSGTGRQPVSFPRTEVGLETLQKKLADKGFKFPFSQYTKFDLRPAS